MPYKTIQLKLLRPGAGKRKALDNAIERYTDAFEAILRAFHERYGDLSGADQPQKPDKELMALADGFHAKPFKDALCLDAAAVLKTYRCTLKASGHTSYPVCRTGDRDIEENILKAENPERHLINRTIDKYGSVRPLLFCRFDARRDYSLLRDGKTGRLYAKLYLTELKDAFPPASGERCALRYLMPGGKGDILEEGKRRRRYLLFPIEPGQWGEEQLLKIERGLASPKSASLFRKNGDYYLNVRLWFEPPETLPCENYLGVARGIKNDLYCAVTDAKGRLIHEKGIGLHSVHGINRLHRLSNEVLKLALRYRCKIVMGDLLRFGDRLGREGAFPPLSPMEYGRIFSLLQYKAEFAGLEKPAAVSALSVFRRCPVCGSVRDANRLESDKFLCVECGYFRPLELVGAVNLAGTLERYGKNKLSVVCREEDGNITFYCRLLGLEYTCRNGEGALGGFFGRVEGYIEDPPRPLDKNRRSILRRLSEAESLSGCFAFELRI